MLKNYKNSSSHDEICCEESCCNVESVITVDEWGQMVLPKEVRKKQRSKPEIN